MMLLQIMLAEARHKCSICSQISAKGKSMKDRELTSLADLLYACIHAAQSKGKRIARNGDGH